jgi:membrane protein DedA with SNARE-associated domain
VVRTFISLPAGIAGVDPVRFGIYTTIGCIHWTPLAYAGYAVGANWQSIVNGLRGPTHITELGWAEPLWPKTSPGDTGEGLAQEAVGR